MLSILDDIFKHYKYIGDESIDSSEIKFYKANDSYIANYFLLNLIDCRDFETDEEKMKEALENLETVYSGEQGSDDPISLRKTIVESFPKAEEASQIDKNTSAIYLLFFRELTNLDKHRNLVYAIEESTNYFKRYILPFTDKQTNGLKSVLNQRESESINIKLSDIADDEDEYYKLLEGKNEDSVYELVIRLFAKIPFLQYRFKTSSAPLSLDDSLLQRIQEKKFLDYHLLIQNSNQNINDFLDIEVVIEISDDELEKELQKMIKE